MTNDGTTYELTAEEFRELASAAQSRHPTVCHEEAPELVEQIREREEPDYACEKHDLQEYPSGYDHCPMCRQEQEVEHRRAEQMAKRGKPASRRMEPW